MPIYWTGNGSGVTGGLSIFTGSSLSAEAGAPGNSFIFHNPFHICFELGKVFLMFFVSHSFVQEDIKVCLSSFKSFNIIVSSCVLKFFLHQTGLSLTMVLFNVSNEPAVSLKWQTPLKIFWVRKRVIISSWIWSMARLWRCWRSTEQAMRRQRDNLKRTGRKWFRENKIVSHLSKF